MTGLILASNSPRRRQLLSITGIPFSVFPVDIDERALSGEAPVDYVLRLAQTKARTALEKGSLGEILLAADTTVADGLLILGKPGGPAEARLMLQSLRGRDHMVYTAIGVGDPSTGRLVSDLCATRVWMRSYSDSEIDDYIASGDPFDKAGGYAIQNQEFHPVERIEGCYACVMGLPVCHVIRVLREFNLHPASDVAAACPEYLALNAPCPVTRLILGSLSGGTALIERQD